MLVPFPRQAYLPGQPLPAHTVQLKVLLTAHHQDILLHQRRSVTLSCCEDPKRKQEVGKKLEEDVERWRGRKTKGRAETQGNRQKVFH